MLERLRMILDGTVSVSNILDKAIVLYGEEGEIFRYSGSLEHLGVKGDTLTFGNLRRLVDRLSNALVNAGLNRYDRVAIFKRGGVEYLIYTLAIIRAGGITAPINSNMKQQDARQYLRYVGARFVFADDSTLPLLDPEAISQGVYAVLLCGEGGEGIPSAVRTFSVSGLIAAQPEHFKAVNVGKLDDVMIIHTSGTTGFPKGVLHCSNSLIRASKGQWMLQPFTRENNKIMLTIPANHHMTQAAIFTCLGAGARAYVPADERGESLVRLIEREKSTLVVAFPDVYQGICALPLERFDLSRIKAWMSSGDSSHEVHVKKLVGQGAMFRFFGRKLLSSVFIDFLGSSEVGFAALVKLSFSFTRRYARYIGRTTWVTPRVRIADADGNDVPSGTPGRLLVKGPTVFKGYWNLHSALHGAQFDGWWWTGDIVKEESGRYYHLDRAVDVIEGSVNEIFSLPIEEVLLKRREIEDVAVVANSQGRPSAIIEIKPGCVLAEADMLAWVRLVLPTHADMAIVILPEGEKLPRGLTGKVLKRLLRDRDFDTRRPAIAINHAAAGMSNSAIQ